MGKCRTGNPNGGMWVAIDHRSNELCFLSVCFRFISRFISPLARTPYVKEVFKSGYALCSRSRLRTSSRTPECSLGKTFALAFLFHRISSLIHGLGELLPWMVGVVSRPVNLTL